MQIHLGYLGSHLGSELEKKEGILVLGPMKYKLWLYHFKGSYQSIFGPFWFKGGYRTNFEAFLRGVIRAFSDDCLKGSYQR